MQNSIPGLLWAVVICLLGTSVSAQQTTDQKNSLAEASGDPVEVSSAEIQEPSGTVEMELADAVQAASRAANNAWMMTAAALVLFMTAPGLALFYGGLVRQKNVLSVMMQCIYLMGMMTLLWAICGYSFAFGGEGAFFGNLDHLFMNGVALQNKVAPGGGIPDLTFMVFQGMFFIITPALICGAFAERMKFSTMVVFSVLWGVLVYCPLCHWVWAESGILYYGGPNAWFGGAIDFAGGTVVHMSSGFSALVVSLLIGNRIGFGSDDMRPHNLAFSAIGAAMLWVGWFGFNAGSAAASNDIAANAFVVTHFSAAAGAFAWASIEWLSRGKPSILGTASGAVAGLVCITPASGCVHPMPAILMGLLAGIACYFACGIVKRAFGYDDSLDAFGIHGVGGILGAILIGFFASQDVGDANGLIYSASEGWPLMVGQLVAVGVTLVYSFGMTWVLVLVLKKTIGLRVDEKSEIRGLDITEHGEEGYIFNR